MIYDIVIENGQLFDGTGDAPRITDVGIKRGKIVQIGDLSRAKAYHVLNAEGSYVAPGFIDILSHTDNYWTLFDHPGAQSLLMQGVTTVLAGNCGSSLAPLVTADSLLALRKWGNEKKLSVRWQTFGQLLVALEEHPLAINFASLVGHSTLRRGYLKDDLRELTEDEFESLLATLHQALAEGAYGFSTGLAYAHEYFTKPEELVPFLEQVAAVNGLYSAHLRNEGEALITSLKEMLAVVKQTGVRAEIAHFKAKGRANWPLMKEALSLITAAQKEGQEINFDIYPYDHTLSILYVYLPSWAFLGGRKMLLDNLTGKRSRRKLAEEMRQQKIDYAKLIVASAPRLAGVVGRTFADIARDAGSSVEVAVLDTLLAANGQMMVFDPSLSMRQVRELLLSPLSLLGSDAGMYDASAVKSGMLVHPRSFANFITFLMLVRDEQLMSWPQAIAKLSSMPAAKIGLKKRGVIRKNYVADVVVFDPQQLATQATYDHPYQYAQGMQHVVINGRIAMQDGKLTRLAAGQVLRRGKD